jgi:hypothetical protein
MTDPTSSRSRRVKESWSLYLDPAKAAALRKLSESTRIPAQVLLREAVDMLLAKYSKRR